MLARTHCWLEVAKSCLLFRVCFVRCRCSTVSARTDGGSASRSWAIRGTRIRIERVLGSWCCAYTYLPSSKQHLVPNTIQSQLQSAASLLAVICFFFPCPLPAIRFSSRSVVQIQTQGAPFPFSPYVAVSEGQYSTSTSTLGQPQIMPLSSQEKRDAATRQIPRRAGRSIERPSEPPLWPSSHLRRNIANFLS
jgi:hypothetical protein